MDYSLLAYAIVPLLSAGAAWGGAKVTLNGTKERVKKLEQSHEDFKTDQQKFVQVTTDRLARIETKMDILLEKH